MTKYPCTAEIYKDEPLPNEWLVVAIDPSGDGGFITTIFSGVEAEARAVEYARQNFRESLHCVPRPPLYQSGQYMSAHLDQHGTLGANPRHEPQFGLDQKR